MRDKITELERRLHEIGANTTRHAEARVDLLNSLAWELRGTDSHRALRYSQEAYTLAETAQYSKGKAYSLYYSGVALRYLAKYDEALSDLLKAYDYFYALRDSSGQAGTLNWMGNVYLRMGNYSIALDYYLQSLQINEELGDTRQIAISYTNIGRVYYGLRSYSDSLAYHLRSLKLATLMEEKEESLVEKAVIFWDISRAYCALENYTDALTYCGKSLELNTITGNRRNLGASYYALGEIYLGMEDCYSALLNLLRAKAIFHSIGEIYGEANANMQMGILYFHHLDRPDKALDYLYAAIHYATQIKASEIEHDAHQMLAEFHKRQNNYKEALYHFEHFYALKSEATNKQTEQAINSLQRHHEIEKEQKEAEIYRLKNVELANALYKVQTLNEDLAQVNIHLEKLNEEKSEFISIVAHDLQNPLAGIAMTASLVKLCTDTMLPEQICQHMSKIEATADRMKEIITNLLNIDAIESGKMHLVAETLSVPELLYAVMAEHLSRARAKSIALYYNETPCAPVVADKQATLQILDNLISNAIKYSPRESSIWMTTSCTHSCATIHIRDEGPGFTEDDKKKMFSKFAQLSAKPTGGEHSTGLGLSIVKKLVDTMGGTIECRSMLGQGSTFILHLPLALSTTSFTSTSSSRSSTDTQTSGEYL